MIFDAQTRWLWKNGVGKARLTIRESQVLRDILKNEPMPEGWNESRNVHQHVASLRAKGVNVITKKGYEIADEIEIIGD